MDNRNLLTLFTYILLIASMSSCGHFFYAPNDNIMLQLKEKNDINVSGGVGLYSGRDTDTSVSTFQVGYSPIKHLAIAGSYFSIKDIGEFNSNQAIGKNWNGAIGTYYFFNFRKNKIKEEGGYRAYAAKTPKGILFDVYAGYGEGNVKNIYESGGKSLVDFQNYFVQGGLHFKSNYLDAGISLKKSILNYHNAKTFYPVYNSQLENLMSKNRYSPLNVSIRVAGGFNFGKFYLNINDVLPRIPEHKIADFNLTIGVQLSVNDIIKGLKKT